MTAQKNTKSISARTQALITLSEWHNSGKPIEIFLNQHSEQLPQRDRSMAQNLVFGVLRNMQSLDQVIRHFSKHPPAKMKPRTLAALRLGVFQLLFMDRIPPSAAINETVNSLKMSGQPKWLLGFSNGLLRNVSRNRETMLQELQKKTPYNHPQWMIERWQNRFGREKMQTVCAVNNTIPAICLRVNTKRCSREHLMHLLNESGVQAQPSSLSPEGIFLEETGSVHTLPGYAEGFFLVQDASAQLAGLLLQPNRPGERFLDACAGLGGKTSHIAQHLCEDATLAAVEPNRRRFLLLKQNLSRLTLQNRVQAIHCSLEELQESRPPRFDAILLDAPCSGTGVIRRQPDIRWNRSPQDLLQYQATQQHLLECCAGLLNPGGRIVYATCSLEQEENQDVIHSFLAKHGNFTARDACTLLPKQAARLVTDEGFFHPLPGQECDGFFAALLVRSLSL